ncbi:Uma2 family endonuclease [Nocardia sp. NPDC058705]|uniref:Uma2 family endonuclease n=1 Tax=Nocardia sp. NPDC058705 TaxID=3346609 RepID=UPI00367E0ECF
MLLWEGPPTARIPDVVVNRCPQDFDRLIARGVFIVVEVVSPCSARRDRIHKMADYADAGIPHYWIVEFDKIGAVSVERYVFEARKQAYAHVETTHRDGHGLAVDVTSPFRIVIEWDQLTVDSRV